jgi:DNA topoisomerase IB
MLALRDCGPASNAAQEKQNITRAVEEVARSLGNTAAISRKSYIHPHAVQHHSRGSLASFLDGCQGAAGDGPAGLAPEEAAALALLRAGGLDEPSRLVESARR